MRKAHFTEHQIIAVIKSFEAERTVEDVCREAGISEATYYNWKSRYGGMEASDIKKIKDLEDETAVSNRCLPTLPEKIRLPDDPEITRNQHEQHRARQVQHDLAAQQENIRLPDTGIHGRAGSPYRRAGRGVPA